MKRVECPNCGGYNDIEDDATKYVCDYCNSPNDLGVVPLNKKVQTFLDRGNAFRLRNDFNDAKENYKRVITEDPTNAEAYWGLTLCDYWVEYVNDPKTGKKIPTCHRTIKEPILESINLKHALENTDAVTREYYRNQAKEISELQNKILRVIATEEPYDIFISYKETDEKGNRTNESKEAVKLYNMLRKEGYKVFYARETLKGKLGIDYEPYIYSALITAKLMLVIGTNKENMESVWVKNEWSRYLDLMEEDYDKHIIPCYADMDPYDIPIELAGIQASNIRDIAFIDDLKIAVEKIFKKDDDKETINNTYIQSSQGSKNSQLQSKLQRVSDLLAYRRKDKYEEAKEVVDSLLLEYPHDYEVNKLALIIDYNCYEISEVWDLIKSRNYPESKGNPTNSVNFKNMFNSAPNKEAKCQLASIDAIDIMDRAQEEVAKTWDYSSYICTLNNEEAEYGELVDLSAYKNEDKICQEVFTYWLVGVKNNVDVTETQKQNLLDSLKSLTNLFPDNYLLKYPSYLENDSNVEDHNLTKYIENYSTSCLTYDIETQYPFLREEWFYKFVEFIVSKSTDIKKDLKALFDGLLDDIKTLRNIFYSIHFESQEEFDKFFEPLEDIIPNLVKNDDISFFTEFLDITDIIELLGEVKKISEYYNYTNLGYYYNFASKHPEIFKNMSGIARDTVVSKVAIFIASTDGIYDLKANVEALMDVLKVTSVNSKNYEEIIKAITSYLGNKAYDIASVADTTSFSDTVKSEFEEIEKELSFVHENLVKNPDNFKNLSLFLLRRSTSYLRDPKVPSDLSYSSVKGYRQIMDILKPSCDKEAYETYLKVLSKFVSQRIFTYDYYVETLESSRDQEFGVISDETIFDRSNSFIEFLVPGDKDTNEKTTAILEHYKKIIEKEKFIDECLYNNMVLLSKATKLNIVDYDSSRAKNKLKKGSKLKAYYLERLAEERKWNEHCKKKASDAYVGNTFKSRLKMYCPIIFTWFARVVLGLGLLGGVCYLCYYLYKFYF